MAQDEKLRALVLTHPKDEQEHWPRTEGSLPRTPECFPAGYGQYPLREVEGGRYCPDSYRKEVLNFPVLAPRVR